MTRDDIIRMAQESGAYITPHVCRIDGIDLEQFAALVAAAEREACADMVLTLTCMGNAKEFFETAAAYIRARGQA